MKQSSDSEEKEGIRSSKSMKLCVLLLTVVAAAARGERADGGAGDKLLSTELGRTQDRRECSKNKCATNLAQKAASDAKCAQENQVAAGAQAAHQVKTLLAEKALEAAKVAEAALNGKQALIEEIQEEIRATEILIAQDAALVRQKQATLNAAMQASQQAAAMHKLLCQASQLAGALEASTKCVLEAAKSQLCHFNKYLCDQRMRLANEKKRLQCVCAECAQTKNAAQCACEAAKCACGNARRKKDKSSGDWIDDDGSMGDGGGS